MSAQPEGGGADPSGGEKSKDTETYAVSLCGSAEVGSHIVP
jgi:hypothetical protein